MVKNLPEEIKKGKDIQRLFGTSFDEFKAIKQVIEAIYTKNSHFIIDYDEEWRSNHSLDEANAILENFKLTKEQIDLIRNN